MEFMGRLLYTVVFQKGAKGKVVATVPSLAGFQFNAPSYKVAVLQAPKRMRSFLKALKKAGDRIPVEPASFRLDTMIVEVDVQD